MSGHPTRLTMAKTSLRSRDRTIFLLSAKIKEKDKYLYDLYAELARKDQINLKLKLENLALNQKLRQSGWKNA